MPHSDEQNLQPWAGKPHSELGADEPVSGSRFFRNGLFLLLVGMVLIWFVQRFGSEVLWSWVKVALGLGFVIFVHELGHFAVAKWCDVHVETFSIGFGPIIPGCSFQRGETLYKIGMLPLGGYVKMVGEGAENDEDDTDPRSFKNKTVSQRMAIISAGVIMNVIFAAICFVVVYMVHGAERPAGLIAEVDSGSPAWRKGVPSGAILRQIGDVRDPYFDDLQPAVMLSQAGEQLTMVYSPHDRPTERVEIQIEPRRDKDDTRPVIGVRPSMEVKLPPKPYRTHQLPVLMTSAAAKAEPPFEFGDTIVGTTDPDHPDKVKPLPVDPHDQEPDFFVYRERMDRLAGKPVVMQVRRNKAGSGNEVVEIKVPPAYHYVLGMRMRMGQVAAVRDDSPAVRSGVKARELTQGIDGDIIKQVEVTEPDGKKTRFVTSRSKTVPDGVTEKELDPLRLPFELEQWAERKDGERKVVLTVLRQVGHAERQDVQLVLDWDPRWKFDKEVPFGVNSPLPIPGLGLAYRVDTFIDAVESGGPADMVGLKKGDVIKAVRFMQVGDKPDERAPGRWHDLESDQWAHVFWNLQELSDYKEMTFRVENEGQVREVDITAAPDSTWPLSDRGFLFLPDLRLQKADNFGEAVTMGMTWTWRQIKQIYLNLRAMATMRVSPKNLGGPIMIAAVAYSFAGENFYAFLLFLGMISINLAVINFLPIPVLDGGHMVFLIYEKLRGRPASEQVRIAATYAGLMLIASLMLFVIYLDVKRL